MGKINLEEIKRQREWAQGLPGFTVSARWPISKDYLRALQRIAVEDSMALPSWAHQFNWDRSQEAVYFREKEWGELNIAQHRVDLYTIQRGLHRVFDRNYDLSIAFRQVVLRSIFEQSATSDVMQVQPRVVSGVIQLALFDQVVYS
jgi:hypothetical protein